MASDDRAGAHELLVELGRGGVGVVHLARRASDGRIVVVKRLRPELARNIDIRRMFLEEARVASRIHHPNVIDVLETGFDAKGVPWMEMEWAPGVSLHAIDEAAPLPRDLYAQVLCDLLSGLHAAHSARAEDGGKLDLVHRDVSPHNVLVTCEGQAKVLDFGIAKVRDSSLDTTTGVVKGKATYLSPEQAARKTVDLRTDLFAVGVMLWQHLAGRRIWEGMSEPEIFHRLVSGQIPDLADVAPETPTDLLAVVRKALAPRPDDRFVSAEELRDALAKASPPRADARTSVARHVTAAFSEELHEHHELVQNTRTGEGERGLTTSARNVVESTATFQPGVVTRGPAPKRRFRAGVALAAAFVAVGLGGFAASRLRAPTAALSAPAEVKAPGCRADDACKSGEHCGEDGACAALAHEGCTVVAPREMGTRPLYLGMMFPLSGPDADAYGRSNARAAELAVHEINRLAGGVPFGASRRPLGLISCDDASDADGRARHLAARVPAVIGFRSSDEALTLSRGIFFPKEVLVVSALNTSPLLSQLPAGDPRLFYRTTASATAFSEPIARGVATMLAPEARRRAGLREGAGVRVAVVRTGNATGVAYADKVLLELGRPPDLDVREIALGDVEAAAALALAIGKLGEFAPHVVVTLGDGLFSSVVLPFEARLRGPERERPIYLGSTPWEDDAFREFIRKSPSRRERFFAVSWPTTHRALLGFVERYRESFGEVLTPSTASPGPYDSVYLLAYAAAALGATAKDGQGVTGPALSRASERLMPSPKGKEPLAVGPTTVVSGLAMVAEGQSVDLQGVLSRFDFDPKTGDSPVDAVLLCTTFDPRTRAVDATDLAIARGPFACGAPGR